MAKASEIQAGKSMVPVLKNHPVEYGNHALQICLTKNYKCYYSFIEPMF